MNPKYLIINLMCVMLLSVFGQAVASSDSTSSRIRVFQEAKITLYPGEYCYGSNSPSAIQASETKFSIFGTRKRVGIPETANMTGSYNEYIIPAGAPLTVMLQWEAEKNGVKASCGPIGSTFYPQVGKDYDVTIGYTGNCFVYVRELYEVSPGKAEARDMPTSTSFPCANK